MYNLSTEHLQLQSYAELKLLMSKLKFVFSLNQLFLYLFVYASHSGLESPFSSIPQVTWTAELSNNSVQQCPHLIFLQHYHYL